jgi:hypothetical protein
MEEYDLYRFTHPDGSSKDWAIRRNPDGTLTTRWGPTSPVLPQASTRRQDKIALENAKRRKGYVYIGQVRIDADGTLRSVRDAQGEALPDEPVVQEHVIYWRIHLVDATTGAWEALEHAIQDLKENLSVLEPLSDGTWAGWKIPEPAFDRAGTIQPTWDSGVRPLLFLMALKKRALSGVRVSLATEDGLEIGDDLRTETAVLATFGTNLESVRPLAEALGLLQPRFNLAAAIRTGQDCWF